LIKELRKQNHQKKYMAVVLLTEVWEMRQGSVFKSIRDSFTTDGLLTDTSNHLADVDD